MAFTIVNQSIFLRAELKLWSKVLARSSRWAVLLIKLKTWDSRIFANTCGNIDKKLQSEFQTSPLPKQLHSLPWLCSSKESNASVWGCSDLFFSPLEFQNFAKWRELCVPPFTSQPVLASSKHLALKMTEVIVMGKRNIFKSWELWTRATRYLNLFQITIFPVV